jgi:hypothetical protein
VFRPRDPHLLQFAAMDRWLHGANFFLEVTALQSKIKSGKHSKFMRDQVHLLQMDHWLRGAVQTWVVPVLLTKLYQ